MRELSLNVMDIVQNSISAKATLITVVVVEDTAADTMKIVITDNGCGMSKDQVANVQNPFYTTRTTRPVGMGIPLFKMAAEMTGGSISIQSSLGKGTCTRAIFRTKHIDMVPLGNINETILLLIVSNPDIDFIYRRIRDGRSFTLSTRELRKILDGIPFNHPDVIGWMRAYLTEGQAELIDHPV